MLHKMHGDQAFPAPAGLRVAVVESVARPIEAPIRVTDPDPIFRVSLVPTAPVVKGWHRLTMRFPDDGTVDVIAQICLANGEEFYQRLSAVEHNHLVGYLRTNAALERITLIISGSGYLLQPIQTSFKRINTPTRVMMLARRLPHAIRRDGWAIFSAIARTVVLLIRRRTFVFGHRSVANAVEKPYETWIRIFDEAPERHRNRHLERLQRLTRRPLFSIIVDLPTLDDGVLARLSRSLSAQIYPRWELVAAVPDAAAEFAVEKIFREFTTQPVHVTARQDDPAGTLNALASKASGDFLLPIPPGSMLRANTLLELALTLELYPDAEIVYSDEDRIDADGRRQDPAFKPAWSPDVFDVDDYFAQPTLLRRSSIMAVGGWRAEVNGARDHDLKMRIVDGILPNKIVHLAKILIHIPIEKASSTSSEPPRESIARSIGDHCIRRQLPAEIVWSKETGLPRLKYEVPNPAPLVSLIIPTRDRADILETCIRSVLTRTTYRPLEILIVDNDSSEPATHALFAKLRSRPAVRILHFPGPFNYSALNNFAARAASGSIIGLLNNDCEVVNDVWLTEMVALASRPDVGCVGCKLLFPDRRIQHAGVQLGIGLAAGHGHHFATPDSAGYMNWLRTLRNVSAVTGACLLIRKQLFDQVGGLDEDGLKVDFNDIDLCLKVRAAGYLNIWTPFAELIHHESVSRGRDSGPANAKRAQSEYMTFQRHWGVSLFSDPYYSPHLTYDREDFSVRTC